MANKFFQTVSLNKEKYSYGENISAQITSKKVLPSKFSIQFNINLKIDKTKTLIVNKTYFEFFY